MLFRMRIRCKSEEQYAKWMEAFKMSTDVSSMQLAPGHICFRLYVGEPFISCGFSRSLCAHVLNSGESVSQANLPATTSSGPIMKRRGKSGSRPSKVIHVFGSSYAAKLVVHLSDCQVIFIVASKHLERLKKTPMRYLEQGRWKTPLRNESLQDLLRP